ncbi:MAG: hypothetical protein V4722_21875 [Bacteroidota bacterium]
MKKVILLCLCWAKLSLVVFSQNVGIGTTIPTSKLDVVSAAITSTNATIYATNNGTIGSAIHGISNAVNTYGVRGATNTGTAVQGYTNGGYALISNASSGAAILVQSQAGYGLVASGKLRFNGGNTNPTDGAVLTCDAEGNATWKRSNLAFFANGAVNNIANHALVKVEFNNEVFDTQNNFVDYAGTVTSGSSVFTAPVAGVYHFSASVLFEKSGLVQYEQDLNNGTIKIMLNGVAIADHSSSRVNHLNSSSSFSDYLYLYIDVDVHLAANDKVWVAAMHEQYAHSSTTSVPLDGSSYNGRFNGELVFAD